MPRPASSSSSMSSLEIALFAAMAAILVAGGLQTVRFNEAQAGVEVQYATPPDHVLEEDQSLASTQEP